MKFIFENEKTKMDLPFLTKTNELDASLRSGLEKQLFFNRENKVIKSLFHMAENLPQYQHESIKSFRNKHKGMKIEEVINHVRLDKWIQSQLDFSNRHTRSDKVPYIKFAFVIYLDRHFALSDFSQEEVIALKKLIGEQFQKIAELNENNLTYTPLPFSYVEIQKIHEALTKINTVEAENLSNKLVYMGNIGFSVGPYFFYLKLNGDVGRKNLDDIRNAQVYNETIFTIRKDKEITRFINNLGNYVCACNSFMHYDKENFNEAHFIIYLLKYLRVWNELSNSGISALSHLYLNIYSKTQKLPNVVKTSIDINYLNSRNTLGTSCLKAHVNMDILSEYGPVIFASSKIEHLDTLFCEVIKNMPNVLNMDDIRQTILLVQDMAIKELGKSTIDIKPPQNSSVHKQMYNWAAYSNHIKMTETLYLPIDEIVDIYSGEIARKNEISCLKNTR